MFNGLTKLNIVDVRENICEINQNFEGNIRIIELKNELESKCRNPIDTLKESIINIESSNAELHTKLLNANKKVIEAENKLKNFSDKKNNQTIIELIRERDAALKELLDAKEKHLRNQNQTEELKDKLSKCNSNPDDSQCPHEETVQR